MVDRPRLVAPLLVVALVAVAGCRLNASGFGPPATHLPSVPSAHFDRTPGTRVGRVRGTKKIDFSLALRLRNRELRAMSARRMVSKGSGRSNLSPQALGRRVGLSLAAIARTERVLRRHGIRVVTQYPQRTALRVEGTAASVERYFHVRLSTYRSPEGVLYHAPARDVPVPSALSGSVVAVAGLNTYRAPQTPIQDLLSPDGVRPVDIETAYQVAELHQAGFSGQGEVVGIFSACPFSDSDIAQWDQLYGVTGPTPQHVPVAGGAPKNKECLGEADLDVAAVRAVAPQAQIRVYETAASDGYAAAVDAVVAAGDVTILNISYGQADLPDHVTSADRLRLEQSLSAAVAQGVNVFVSSGDDGAYQARQYDKGDDSLAVAWPADSPNVISVGGTLLFLGQDGGYAKESGWQDQLEPRSYTNSGGGGGGLSTVDPRPSWQAGPGVNNQYSDGHRQLPDVAGPADPDSGIATVLEGEEHGIGGTSAAAPFWSGITALLEQYAKANGVPKLGFLPPTLYKLAAGTPTYAPFHDVKLGGNLFYPATPGWDYSTGLGSPYAFNLARDLVEALKQ